MPDDVVADGVELVRDEDEVAVAGVQGQRAAAGGCSRGRAARASPTLAQRRSAPTIGIARRASRARCGSAAGTAPRSGSSGRPRPGVWHLLALPDHADDHGGTHAMQGLMQDVPLTLPHFFERAEQAVPRQGDRHRHGDGPRAHHLRRVGRAHPPARRRARRPRHQRRRPGGHVRAGTRPATSSCTSRRRAPAGCCTRSTSGCSPSSSPTSSTTPRTRSSSSTGRCSALLWPLVDHLRDRAPHRGDGRRQGRGARAPTAARPRSTTTRTCWPPPTRSTFRRRRREPGRVDVLHERHHRATPRASSTPTARRSCTRWARWLPAASACPGDRPHPAGRADVPRQRLGPRPRRAWPSGANLVMPGPDLSAAVARRPHRGGEGHVAAGVPTIWMGVLPELEGRDLVRPAGHPVRRLGRAAGAVGGVPRADRACRSCRPGA